MNPFEKPNGRLLLLAPNKIDPSPWQARTSFETAELSALAASIRENGLLQPVTVRRADGRFQLIAGERRLRACMMAGLEKIPCILYEQSDAQTAALGLLENLQRQDLDPFDQARGLRDVISLWGCSQRIGSGWRSPRWQISCAYCSWQSRSSVFACKAAFPSGMPARCFVCRRSSGRPRCAQWPHAK